MTTSFGRFLPHDASHQWRRVNFSCWRLGSKAENSLGLGFAIVGENNSMFCEHFSDIGLLAIVRAVIGAFSSRY